MLFIVLRPFLPFAVTEVFDLIVHQYFTISVSAAGFDFTCHSDQPLLEPGDYANYVGGYKAGDARDADVDFSRAVDTRNGKGLTLPDDSSKRNHPAYGSDVRQLVLLKDAGVERIGVFNCEVTKGSVSHKIPTIILHGKGKKRVFFFSFLFLFLFFIFFLFF